MIVRHRLGQYDICFERLAEAASRVPSDSRVITDSNVVRYWGEPFRRFPLRVLRPGEQSKSISVYQETLQWLADTGASRRTAVVALGGGVIGDLAGFVAATYMRGVPLIQIPTTLLAMVDSSIGGKVGIDIPQGKNLAGAFYPPDTVHVCVETLSTLPEREFRNGMAEVIKYGLILDENLASLLEQEQVCPKWPGLSDIVRRCIDLKSRVVEEDELETSGLRAILNFGHTVGHALELATGFSLSHGEAVAIGMIVEARLGEGLGISPHGLATRVGTLVSRYGLPRVAAAMIETRTLLEAMRRDKKASSGSLAFSLLESVGRCKLVENVPQEAVEAALRAC